MHNLIVQHFRIYVVCMPIVIIFVLNLNHKLVSFKPAPFPKDELDRIISLSDFNPDYLKLDDTFKDLTQLAAKVTGSPISMVNLIDSYTVWTVSGYNFEVQQTPREESVCQYTILQKEEFAVNDMSVDPVFKTADFVTGDAHFRFYHGIPLSVDEHNLGALCVLDMQPKLLSAEKVEMLKLIASEIVNRLKTLQYIETLRNKATEAKDKQNKVAHDIRGPIAGIMGLAEIISSQGQDNELEEVLDFINLIYKGGKSVLQLADDILTDEKKARTKSSSANDALLSLKKRFEELYTPQARSKNIELKVDVKDSEEEIKIQEKKLTQIAGNLISNAIKFTPRFGDVFVTIEITGTGEEQKKLKLVVKDSGTGITDEQIALLLADNTESQNGTDGETGFGFGLALVKHLVKGLNGTFNITSGVGSGSQFEVVIPSGA